MRGGQNPLQLEAPLARVLRMAFGIALLVVLFLVVGAAGSFAATSSGADESTSSMAPAKRPGLLSGIVNPVVAIVDQALNQVPVANEVTGSDTVGTVLEPVTGVTDRLENTLNSVPVVDGVTAPVREVTTAVVPPVTDVVADVTTAVVPPVANVVSGVATAVLPPVVTKGVLAPVVDVAAGITTGLLPPVAGAVPVVTTPVLDVVDQVVDTVATSVPGVSLVPAIPVVPEVPVKVEVPAAPTVPEVPVASAAPVASEMPPVMVAPVDPGVRGEWSNTHTAVVDANAHSGADSGSDAAQETIAQKSGSVEASKSRAGARDGTAAENQNAQELATVVGMSPLAQYMTAIPAPKAIRGPSAQGPAIQPSSSPAAATCGSDAGGAAVGPCLPATPVSTGSSSSMSSSGPGASGGSSAAHENSSKDFQLAGGSVPLSDADWPLPASMPSNPGSTPG